MIKQEKKYKREFPTTVLRFMAFFLYKQKKGFACVMFFAIAVMIAGNAIEPYIIGSVVDGLANLERQKHMVFALLQDKLILIVLFWVTLEATCRCKGVVLGIVMPRFEARIRLAVFSYISHHVHGFFTHRHVGSIAQRIDDLPKGMHLIVDDIMTVFIPLLVSLLLSMILFYQVHPMTALVFFTWVAIHGGIVAIYYTKAVFYSSNQADAHAILQGKIVDSIRNYISVKLFNALKHEGETVAIAQEDVVRKYRQTLLYFEKVKVILGLASLGGMTTLFIVSVKLWQLNCISIGDIIFLMNSMVSTSITMWFASDELSYVLAEIGKCKQALSLVQDATEAQFYGGIDLVIRGGQIAFNNVTFSYPVGDNIFSELSVVIAAKQRVGLVGFSGSGKSTFAALLMRLYDPQSGHICIDGRDIKEVDIDSLRRNIVLIPQDPVLFHRSIKDNIRYGKRDATDADIISAAERAHCSDFIERLQHRYDTNVGESGALLSGGQRQRILMARAILKNAPIVIMDEATSALDAFTERKIQQSLDYMAQDKTVLVIAHRLSTLLHMDRILVFHHGIIIEDGTHESLLRSNGHYALLWNTADKGFLGDGAVLKKGAQQS